MILNIYQYFPHILFLKLLINYQIGWAGSLQERGVTILNVNLTIISESIGQKNKLEDS